MFEDVLQNYNASLVRPRIEHAQVRTTYVKRSNLTNTSSGRSYSLLT